MSCDTLTMLTPQKPAFLSGPDEIYLIEDIEKKLENFSHILEKSTEKEKSYLRRINEQTSMICSLRTENQNLSQENEKLRLTIDNCMKNFVCFVENLKRASALEEENLALKQRIDQLLNETSDKIVDLELEKDRIQKENISLTSENKELRKEITELKGSVERLNEFVLNSFKNSLAYARETKIKTLEESLKDKENQISKLKVEIEKGRDNYEKTLKQKTLEYELLKMDYQSAIVQNIQSRQTTWKGEKTKNDKSDKNEKALAPLTDISNRKIFQLVHNKPENQADNRPARKAKNTFKKNTSILTVKEEIENATGSSDNDDEFEIQIEENEELMEEDEDEEENYIPKKGKRKAKEIKKKQPTKKVKKNENKELLLVNRNMIKYHLFN